MQAVTRSFQEATDAARLINIWQWNRSHKTKEYKQEHFQFHSIRQMANACESEKEGGTLDQYCDHEADYSAQCCPRRIHDQYWTWEQIEQAKMDHSVENPDCDCEYCKVHDARKEAKSQFPTKKNYERP
jgi:hypothetical protein